MSTGIGTENIDIVMNELDALVNIDLKKKEFKSEHTALQLFRLGTCGSVNPDVEVDNIFGFSKRSWFRWFFNAFLPRL